MQSETPAPHVYAAIAEVAGKLAKDGISKNRNNAQQGYKFRGIDDVYNALAPVLSECALCILPNVLEREQVERQTKNGGVLIYTTVKVEFIFVSAKDGSQHAVSTYGEAMDSGDKSTNKAMSAAYKYAAMQAFCIPTEGDHDAENSSHELAPQRTSKPRQTQSKADAAMQVQRSGPERMPTEKEFADGSKAIFAMAGEVWGKNSEAEFYAWLKREGWPVDEEKGRVSLKKRSYPELLKIHARLKAAVPERAS